MHLEEDDELPQSQEEREALRARVNRMSQPILLTQVTLAEPRPPEIQTQCLPLVGFCSMDARRFEGAFSGVLSMTLSGPKNGRTKDIVSVLMAVSESGKRELRFGFADGSVSQFDRFGKDTAIAGVVTQLWPEGPGNVLSLNR